ncbi:hypothetical protein LZ30DRAFT_379255 [Colletotrichum cereale]|nr:hypothetical protein LZ30DRAFT_379255 [Colletotrichum cereale]
MYFGTIPSSVILVMAVARWGRDGPHSIASCCLGFVVFLFLISFVFLKNPLQVLVPGYSQTTLQFPYHTCLGRYLQSTRLRTVACPSFVPPSPCNPVRAQLHLVPSFSFIFLLFYGVLRVSYFIFRLSVWTLAPRRRRTHLAPQVSPRYRDHLYYYS